MRVFQRALIRAEALWAQHTVKLAPEPPGPRAGTVLPEQEAGSFPHAGGTHGEVGDTVLPEPGEDTVSVLAIGDSLVAGCGVAEQSQGFVPRVASGIAAELHRPVRWQTNGRLGATMRRVRYRFMPEIHDHVDLLIVCAASNDILAGRSREDYAADLEAVLRMAQDVADHVVVCSAGQPHMSPALPRALRGELARRIEDQVADGRALSQEYGAHYCDLAHVDLVPDFWATDRFHPSGAGYQLAADTILELLQTVDR